MCLVFSNHIQHCRSFIVTFALLISASALAQSAGSATIEAPSFVCSGDAFDVEWTGPGESDDLIALTRLNAPATELMGWESVTEGNPVSMQAPLETATYELRYIDGDPRTILADRYITVSECGSSSNQREDTGGPALVVTGIQTEYGDRVETPGFTRAELCSAGDLYARTLNQIVDQIEISMAEVGSPITISTIENLPGAPNRADIAADVRNAREEFCNGESGPIVYPFAITYAHCRMAMVTPYHAMDIHLPPRIGTGAMSMADHNERKVMRMTLTPSIDAVSSVVGSGWGNMIEMNATGSDGEHIGYDTDEYAFSYTGGLGGGAAASGVAALGNMISVTNSGTAWVSDAIPGIEIMREFYANLTTEVSLNQGASSFFGGLVSNLVGMLREGIPLEVDQTVSSMVMGRTTVSGRSHSIVTGTRMMEFKPGWCSQSVMPSDYEFVDLDQQISEAMSQAPGGQYGDSAEMAEAMQQMNEAMQQMTPEQREMLQQMGLGGSVPGAAVPDGRSAGSNVAPPAASTATRSAALTTDNLAQSVQLHLQALGYDTGNTDGNDSLLTTVAISQYQAERNMPVTGEVSPQLLGILSAEVDR